LINCVERNGYIGYLLTIFVTLIGTVWWRTVTTTTWECYYLYIDIFILIYSLTFSVRMSLELGNSGSILGI